MQFTTSYTLLHCRSLLFQWIYSIRRGLCSAEDHFLPNAAHSILAAAMWVENYYYTMDLRGISPLPHQTLTSPFPSPNTHTRNHPRTPSYITPPRNSANNHHQERPGCPIRSEFEFLPRNLLRSAHRYQYRWDRMQYSFPSSSSKRIDSSEERSVTLRSYQKETAVRT